MTWHDSIELSNLCKASQGELVRYGIDWFPHVPDDILYSYNLHQMTLGLSRVEDW